MPLQDWSSPVGTWRLLPFPCQHASPCTCSDEGFLFPTVYQGLFIVPWIRGRDLHCRCVVGSDAPLVKSSLALLWGSLPDFPYSRTLTTNGSISFPTFSFLALAQTNSISNEHHFQSFTLTPRAWLWDGGQPHPTKGQPAMTIHAL